MIVDIIVVHCAHAYGRPIDAVVFTLLLFWWLKQMNKRKNIQYWTKKKKNKSKNKPNCCEAKFNAAVAPKRCAARGERQPLSPGNKFNNTSIRHTTSLTMLYDVFATHLVFVYRLVCHPPLSTLWSMPTQTAVEISQFLENRRPIRNYWVWKKKLFYQNKKQIKTTILN